MNLLEIFQNKKDLNSIGKFECSREQLKDTVLGLAEKINILNPRIIASKAGKSIKITKKTDKYIIELLTFNPPVKIEWTDLENTADMLSMIERVIEEGKSIGYISTCKNQNSFQSQFQFALA